VSDPTTRTDTTGDPPPVGEYDVPDGTGDGNGDRNGGDGPPYRCGYCGRPFARERPLALHRGLDHAAGLTGAERAAFEEARETERADLRRFRLKALLALVVGYFGFVMAYSFFA